MNRKPSPIPFILHIQPGPEALYRTVEGRESPISALHWPSAAQFALAFRAGLRHLGGAS